MFYPHVKPHYQKLKIDIMATAHKTNSACCTTKIYTGCEFIKNKTAYILYS